MQDGIIRVHSTPTPARPRGRQQRGSGRPFTLPDDESGDEADGQREVVLQPRPRPPRGVRIGTEPLAEEAGQSLDVRA